MANHIHIDGNAYVVAKGSDRAIGGSSQESREGKAGDAKDIVISGTSTVYAEGGIGSGGTGTYGNKGGDTDITIKGNSTVYANSRGNNYASGDNGGTTIGSGYGGDATIRIAGNAKVKSVISVYYSYLKKYVSDDTGVGIGGYGGNADITIADDAIIGDGSSSIGSSGYADYQDKTTTITISDRAAIGEMLDGTYIGTNASSPSHGEKQNADITIQDNVWIKNVSRIGTKTGNAIIKILDNATINMVGSGTTLGSSYSAADITLGGKSAEDKEEGTVTINATGGSGTDKPYDTSVGSHPTGFGIIGSNGGATLNFGGKVKLVLKNAQEGKIGPLPFIHVKDPDGHWSYVEPTDEQMKELLKDNAEVSIDYVKADGTVTKIAHSSDLCEVEDGKEMDVVVEPTCTTPGKGQFTCAYEKNRGVTGDDLYHTGVVKEVEIPALGHDFGDWHVTKKATCKEEGEMQRECQREGCTEVETEPIAVDPANHVHTKVINQQDATCEEPGYTGDTVCDTCGKVLESGTVLPATGSNDSNVACELRVVVPGSTLRELWFTVRQSGGERTYTCKQDNATLTGSLETLQYLQSQGADTIVFVTNGRVSRFAVADLLALCNEGDVFYLCHTADAEPTLLIIANDHTELLNS